MTERRVEVRRRDGVGDVASLGGAFDKGRQLCDKAGYSACYAPIVSMYFDQFGNVRACCQNSDAALGNVGRNSLREIWEGAAAQRLRQALGSRDFSVGCGFCKWQVDEGGSSPFARGFDRFAVPAVDLEWPLQMEFSMTNSCNLQCVMCNGDLSSSIRAHREHRRPLPAVYGESFFEQLAEFLPHLEHSNFLGGEPFLGKEPLRVMEMMIDLGLDAPIAVTTNATQWSNRIERICEELPVSFVVSLDGITKDTFESVRIGAEFDQVMANIDRFAKIVESTDADISIAHCLMRPNWAEFADLLLFAEEKQLDGVGVNAVLFPKSLSLYQMEESELSEVVEAMERQDVGSASALQRFRPVWEEQLSALQNRLRTLQTVSRRLVEPWPLSLVDRGSADLAGLVDWGGGREPCVIRCDLGWALRESHEVNRPIVEVDERFAELVGLDPSEIIGRPMSFILDALRSAFGDDCVVGPAASGRPHHVQAEFRSASDGAVHEAQVVLIEEDESLLVMLVHREVLAQ